MPELVCRHRNGYILIEEKVLSIFGQWKQIDRNDEAGGTLIGFRRGNHLHVVLCTEPHNNDHHTFTSFFRKSRSHKTIAMNMWHKTNGHAYYLGEWHTHPVPNPIPSFLDKLEWKKLSKIFSSDTLLFIIVGTESLYIQYCNEILHPI